MAVKSVGKADFESEVLKSETPVLVDFKAEWCGPCKMLKSTIEEISDERDDVKVVSVDIDEEDELAEDYDVFSIPCLVLFKNGEEAARSVGLKSKDEIVEMFGDK